MPWTHTSGSDFSQYFLQKLTSEIVLLEGQVTQELLERHVQKTLAKVMTPTHQLSLERELPIDRIEIEYKIDLHATKYSDPLLTLRGKMGNLRPLQQSTSELPVLDQ